MKNYCIMRIDKKPTIAAATGTERHNNRTAPKYNRPLTEEEKVINIMTEYKRSNPRATFSQFFNERTQGQKVRKNAVKAVEMLFSFSAGSIPPERLREWAGDCYKFLCKHFGKENIFSCYLHLESNYHIHALFLPMDDNGKLSAAHYFNGREKMQQWQTLYYEEIGKKYGLERGKDKAESNARHTSLKEYRAQLDEQAKTNETIIADLNGYRHAFGIPSAAWDKYGRYTLTDFLEGRAEAQNEIARRRTPPNIDKGRSR